MNVKRMVNNQNMIFDILKSSYENNRLSHAYLFYGDEGTGKKEMAYALACLMYCPNGGCLECETCTSIITGNHMNVDYIGIAEDKTVISKDQITDLQEEFSKTSLVEGTRVYIVDGIDTASAAAQNSLLKFIEEPINQTPTVGIFIAKDLSNVVPTIQSRCILQHFKALPIDLIIDSLKQEGIEEIDAILCANLTNSLDEAYSIATNDGFTILKDLFIKFVELKNPKEGVLYYLDNLSVFSEGANLKILTSWLVAFLEDAIFHMDNPDSLLLKPLYDKIKVYKNKNYETLSDKLKTVLDLSNKLKYNVSAKNVFHELISKLV